MNSFTLLGTPHQLPNYTVVATIYQGTYTTVYRAVETTTQQPVVIKVQSQKYPSFAELVQFRNQYTVAKNLPIAGIVCPLSLEPLDNGYALIMEDFGGIDLGQYVQQSPLSLTETLDIAIQLADILHELHQHRVIHKDLKPANILLHPDAKQVQLIDFSIASLLPKETQAIQNPRSLEGTLAYMAPEQTGRMNRAIDYRTDFYSLGITLYQLLTGKLPFTSDDPLELIHCHMAQLPVAVDHVNPAVPSIVATIVAKLTAKNAEDRYQSALGLKHDLEQCLTQWQAQGDIGAFALGTRDRSDRFLIPEKLYGREAAVQTLLAAFARVAQGSSELMLVAGFSGIGKTAVVNEVHKPIVQQRGYFIKGKFDQFNRNVPFSAFVQACRSLMGQLLSESDGELANWQANILTALGKSGQVLIDAIPELEHIIGKQPTPPELSGNAAQNRFNRLFQKFIAVFTTPEHPLVIFLDDLQWADSASLNLLNLLMKDSSMGHLLVLGAYRDNEVFPAHPLLLTLEDIKQEQATIHTLTLKPLATEHIHRLVADTLLCETEVAAPLTALVYQKTQGNPFFTTQFLYGLHAENLITFDSVAGYWQCDLTQIQQLTLTDDVIEFMVGRLQKLPPATQALLQLAACIGNRFDLETLAIVCDRSQYEVAVDLWRSLQDGLVIPENNTYKFFQGDRRKDEDTDHDMKVGYCFLHDRVQQAAYALIKETDRPSIHLKIGRLLWAQQSSKQSKSNIFKIVNNLNKGVGLIDNECQRQQLASLNLEAGQQAKSSVAYVEAVAYIEQGINLLSPQGWTTHYALTLELYSELAEIQFFRGDFETVERISSNVLEHIQQTADALPIYIVKLSSDLAQGEMVAGFNLGLKVLNFLGVKILPEAEGNSNQQKQHQILTEFKAKTIQDLIDLPQNHDPKFLRIQELLTVLVGYAYKFKPELLPLIIGEQVALLIHHGNIPASASIYALYGMLLCGSEDIESGFFAGEVALNMMDLFPAKKYEMRVRNLIYSYINPWKTSLRDSLSPLKQGFTTGLEVGDMEYTSYGINHYAQFLYFSGADLATVNHEISTYCDILENYRQEVILTGVRIFHQMVLNLIHESNTPWQLEGKSFQESKYITDWQRNHLEYFLCTLHINKLVLSVLFNRPTLGLNYAALAHASYKGLTGEFQLSYFHCYRALAHLAVLKPLESEQKSHELTQVAIDLAKLEQFASHAPMNFQHQVELIQAERYRVLGQRLEAMDTYDRAIALAKTHGYSQEEALANELTAKFYLDRGQDKIAAGYMQEAYYCYSRWGAKAKVVDLETRYSELLRPILQSSASFGNALSTLMTLATPTNSGHTTTHHSASSSSLNQTLDFASILKASQALSSTIQLDELLCQLTKFMLQNSGGDRCALILPNESGEWQVKAIATFNETHLATAPLTNNPNLPVKLIQYVKNTQETIVIDDLITDLPILDDYLRQHKPKSVLCLPLLNQGHLIGILYLKNQLTSTVFTKDRLLVLNFLCTQAAISLENARLYEQTQHYAKQLEKSQLQLVQHEKMATLGNLVAGVAHEVNNPIGFLNGSISNAQDYIKDLFEHLETYQWQQPPNEAVRASAKAIDLEFLREDFPNLLGSMQTAADRITDISTSLRIFSRTGTKDKVNANLHEGLDSNLLILKYRLKENEHRPAIAVIKNYGDLPEIKCFPAQLNQVFMNILANAIDMFDAMAQQMTFAELEEAPQEIMIETIHLAAQNMIEIRISDNGAGMNEEVKSRIFDHLFTTKGIGKGTGLGLAIAHKIVVETHGGNLDVRSEVGQGTEFYIRLPL
ncbi:MAG: ATP-binding sensor histidine kinase [Cyanobacteria bacterium J06639_14]